MCTARHRKCSHRSGMVQTGVGLIELIVFIVVVGIAVTGVMSAMSSSVAKSADPIARKQAIAVAEGLLEEIAAQAFTWCDPDDAAYSTASSTAFCAVVEASGPETSGGTETRYAVPLFDNVNDYNGFSMSGIRTATSGTTVILSGYSASVVVTQVGTTFGLADNTAALRVDVRVFGNGEDITLTGYRFRHSPNSSG